MKGIICFYSSTGNTLLACQYIARNISSVHFDLFDIAKNQALDLDSYDVVGFASPTDYFAPPALIKRFIDKLPEQSNKPAFVFNTYGLFSGRTSIILKDWVKEKGFNVIAGHSLNTPENFPPFRVKGIKSEKRPKPKNLENFKKFVHDLNDLFNSQPLHELKEVPIKIGVINSLFPSYPRTKAKQDMGEKYVDHALCTECGVCKTKCPYQAIEMNPKPVFDMEKCYGCWSCFNHCSYKAIYTKKVRGKGHYPKPIVDFKEKLTDID